MPQGNSAVRPTNGFYLYLLMLEPVYFDGLIRRFKVILFCRLLEKKDLYLEFGIGISLSFLRSTCNQKEKVSLRKFYLYQRMHLFLSYTKIT